MIGKRLRNLSKNYFLSIIGKRLRNLSKNYFLSIIGTKWSNCTIIIFFLGGGGGVKCWITCLNKMIDCPFSNWSIFEKKVYNIVTPDWFSPDQKVATLYESLRLHQYFARHLLYNSHYWHLWCDITVSICVIWTETKSTLCLTFMISQDFFFNLNLWTHFGVIN